MGFVYLHLFTAILFICLSLWAYKIKLINFPMVVYGECLVLMLPLIGLFLVIFLTAQIVEVYYKKENNMNIFKNNNSIDNVLNKKKQVEELEKKLEQEKQDMFKLKGKAKEDLQWILSE